jgi:hypothetical protein
MLVRICCCLRGFHDLNNHDDRFIVLAARTITGDGYVVACSLADAEAKRTPVAAAMPPPPLSLGPAIQGDCP